MCVHRCHYHLNHHSQPPAGESAYYCALSSIDSTVVMLGYFDDIEPFFYFA
jgi:hypothetical protein